VPEERPSCRCECRSHLSCFVGERRLSNVHASILPFGGRGASSAAMSMSVTEWSGSNAAARATGAECSPFPRETTVTTVPGSRQTAPAKRIASAGREARTSYECHATVVP
jgi:hypothetical protein